jgi:hypothetical protein
VTDLTIYGEQLRRPTRSEMGIFPRAD